MVSNFGGNFFLSFFIIFYNAKLANTYRNIILNSNK